MGDKEKQYPPDTISAEAAEKMKQDFKDLKEIQYIVIIVLLIGFAALFATVGGFVMQSMADKRAAELELVSKIEYLNARLDSQPVMIKSTNAPTTPQK
jgi:hypothetical protein